MDSKLEQLKAALLQIKEKCSSEDVELLIETIYHDPGAFCESIVAIVDEALAN